jgi:hypothetical protein
MPNESNYCFEEKNRNFGTLAGVKHKTENRGLHTQIRVSVETPIGLDAPEHFYLGNLGSRDIPALVSCFEKICE